MRYFRGWIGSLRMRLRITAAQTLEVVYGFFQTMRDVVDGEQIQSAELVALRLMLIIIPFRRKNIE